MRGALWIAHEQVPGAAELRIHVAVPRHVVLDDGLDQRIDAFVARRIVWTFGLTGTNPEW